MKITTWRFLRITIIKRERSSTVGLMKLESIIAHIKKACDFKEWNKKSLGFLVQAQTLESTVFISVQRRSCCLTFCGCESGKLGRNWRKLRLTELEVVIHVHDLTASHNCPFKILLFPFSRWGRRRPQMWLLLGEGWVPWPLTHQKDLVSMLFASL